MKIFEAKLFFTFLCETWCTHNLASKHKSSANEYFTLTSDLKY